MSDRTPNTICRECGTRIDPGGLCQCVDVLLARIRELEEPFEASDPDCRECPNPYTPHAKVYECVCNLCRDRTATYSVREQAVAAWNALMRPRPVARWGEPGDYTQRLMCGAVELGDVTRLGGRVPRWRAYCALTGEESADMPLPSARAWLEERVRAAGFEVAPISG